MKKRMILGVICALIGMQQVIGQEKEYTVRGKLSGMNDDVKIVMVNTQNGGFSFDTLQVENGRFTFTGKTDQRSSLTFMRLSQKEREESRRKSKGKGAIMAGKFDLTFFVTPGAVVEIQGNQKDFPFLEVVSKDALNEAAMELQKLNLQELKEINRLHGVLNEALWAGDTLAKKATNTALNGLREQIEKRTVEWIAAHPEREYAAWLYLRSGLTSKTPGELQAQYDRFSASVQQSESGKKLAEMIRVRSALLPGGMAPEFTLKNIYTGEDISLGDYRGKYVLLDFWASWCGPCRNSHPHLIRINEKYKDEKFVILGIASDRQDAVIKDAAAKDEITWAQMNIYEKRDGQGKVNELYDVSALPTKILIDPQGKMVVKYIGDVAEIDQKLEEIFGK